tara:strand:+ start:11482 stop:11757 length:276 start_codon:yes stop_codon:yes gene_type:complete
MKKPNRSWGDAPKKNSSQWKKNESLIAKNPTLRAARDTAEGFKPGSGISTGPNDEEYKAGYDKIDWTKRDNTKRNYKIKINGVYQDDDQEE